MNSTSFNTCVIKGSLCHLMREILIQHVSISHRFMNVRILLSIESNNVLKM